MGLPNSQRHILAAIEDELQADPDLAASFSAFTSVTRGAAMPAVEQLRLRSWLASWRSLWRGGLPESMNRQIALLVAMMAALAVGLTVALAALLGGHQARCEPACACARTCYAILQVPPALAKRDWP